jgi:quinol monooxygenase YgiN
LAGIIKLRDVVCKIDVRASRHGFYYQATCGVVSTIPQRGIGRHDAKPAGMVALQHRSLVMTPVVAIFVAKPGTETLVEGLFRDVIATTLNEDGCISYQLNRDVAEPRRFVWTELWSSRELLQKHLAAPHITKLFGELQPHIESSEVITLGIVAGGAASSPVVVASGA